MQKTILNPGVFTIDNFLALDECTALIALAERDGFSTAMVRANSGTKAMPTIRNNERAEFESPAWVSLLQERLQQMDLPRLDGASPCGLPAALRFYKYTAGQRFKMHKDGPWSENGMQSKLTFLVYLNEAFSGGETDFRDFKVAPKTGMALLFVHATWHEGCAVTSGEKYVLRSDVLYRPD